MPTMAKDRPKRVRISKSKPKTKWAGELRTLRDRRQLTQEDAAKRSGVPLSTWIAWENGVHVPSRLTQKYLRESVFPKL